MYIVCVNVCSVCLLYECYIVGCVCIVCVVCVRCMSVSYVVCVWRVLCDCPVPGIDVTRSPLTGGSSVPQGWPVLWHYTEAALA